MTILRDRHDMTADLMFLEVGPEAAFFCIFISGWNRRGDIAYWIFNYMPHWEAASKEAQTLLRTFGGKYTTQLFSLNQDRRLKLRGSGEVSSASRSVRLLSAVLPDGALASNQPYVLLGR